MLAEPASVELVRKLEDAKVPGLSVGRAIIATWEPHEVEVLEAIRELGLELQIIFNKGAVMVLPPASIRPRALPPRFSGSISRLRSRRGRGDAENDHAFIKTCGCAVAVANAIPALIKEVDIVTEGERGAGVTELIDRMIATDLQDIASLHARVEVR